MDGNKDESERCRSIAQKCINEGDRNKALKFLYKAERLYPSQRAKDLIELLEKLSDSTSDTNRGRNENVGLNGTRCRSGSRRRQGSSQELKNDYTSDQLEAVQKIKRCKDFYEILGVTKDAGESDIKKQYRKLALQFHPDKNKAPGATEAFKAIGNAFAVLNDPEKRKQYDAFGATENKGGYRRQSCHRNGAYYEYNREFESDISAEELFNIFFGGGFTPGTAANSFRRPQRRFHTRDANNAERASNYSLLMHLMPVLALVVLSLITSLFISDPHFSLLQSVKYPTEMKTSNLGVLYYVRETFPTKNQDMLRNIEAQVEEEHKSNLRTSCFKERNYRESLIWRARSVNDRQLVEKAKNMKTNSCDKFYQLTNERIYG